MLAAALALAFTAAPIASGHQLANNPSPTPHSLGLPGGTLNPTGGGDPRVTHRVLPTPHSLGLPGGTLKPTGR
jgi:hypothetical protein